MKHTYRVQFNDLLNKWYLMVWRPRLSTWSGIKAFNTQEEAEAACREYNRRGED